MKPAVKPTANGSPAELSVEMTEIQNYNFTFTFLAFCSAFFFATLLFSLFVCYID